MLAVYMQPPSSDPPTSATLQVARFGALVATFTRAIAPDTVWRVADLSTAGGTITPTALDDVCVDTAGFCGDPAAACN